LRRAAVKELENGGDPGGFFGKALEAGYGFLRASSTGPDRDTQYEQTKLRDDWFAEIPRARGSLFRYPMMSSPGAFFGGGPESISGTQTVPAQSNWRDFAAQAIGEAGMSSALSLAVLYSAVARNDGAIVAPRLVRTGEAPSLRKIFEATPTRVQAVRAALKAPLQPDGTAHKLPGCAALRDMIPSLYAKTGTFQVRYETGPEEQEAQHGRDILQSCGAITWNGAEPRARAVSLADPRLCEEEGLTVTGVHRYVSELPVPQQQQGSEPTIAKGVFTSFVAVLIPPATAKGKPRAVVLSIIVDMNGVVAQNLAKSLLPTVWRWMNGVQ